MTQTDPFAAASMTVPAVPAPATAGDNPFNGVDIDSDNPFATEDTVNSGGNFLPTPSPESLNGRLVVYIPRSFRKDALVPAEHAKTPGETREEWRADLYVVDPVDLTYVTNRTDPKTNAKTPETTVIPASDMPAEFLNVFVPQAALIGALRRVDGTAKPLLMGRLRRGPIAAEARKGKTFADIERDFVAWREAIIAGRDAPKPRSSWQVDVAVTPEDARLAIAWWRGAKDTIKPIVKAPDLTGTPVGTRS